MFHSVVDLFHFKAMIFHNGAKLRLGINSCAYGGHLLVERLCVLLQVTVCHIRYLTA